MDSPFEKLLWTLRHIYRKEAFPVSHREISCADVNRESYFKAVRTWEFLASFFASRGYNPHTKDPKSDYLLPVPDLKHPEDTTYPFARFIPGKYNDFFWGAPSLWAARDKLGRDVVIKMISDVSCPSQELRALQRLNSKDLRSDPLNHTIPVLDFLTFDNLVFVVMPRWNGAFEPEFEVVEELLEMTKVCLEAFVFLHRNRIVHLDFLGQNTSMNVILDDREPITQRGLRRPGEVRYALIDFGNAIVFPEDTIIENVIATRPLNYWLRDLPKIDGAYNPFKADIAFLGAELEYKVRHIENIIPELGPFFENLKSMMDDTQFTAPQALFRFLEIYNNLTPEQLQMPVVTRTWRNVDVQAPAKLVDAPMDPAYHPSNIGNVVSHLLSETFGCRFKASDSDINAQTDFSDYVESLLSATKLPFRVTVASIILLQRLYTRLPDEVFELRKHFSPYQLFTGAYIVAAKQYTHFRLGLDICRLIMHSESEEPTFERDGVTAAVLMSNEYWAKRTSYSVQDVKKIQRQFIVALGGGVVVFPVKEVKTQEVLKQLKSLSIRRRLPSDRQHFGTSPYCGIGLKNLGHMTAEEHKVYFEFLGQRLPFIGSPIEVQVRL
ncbi:hypothetical protein JR316_0009153 [Psilocybe cubensis]|uniref:Uncharacterized protein n=1 Tax=Psilocybe cubensis TaxID=181762 RepID=A0ACB8GT97_PSICU|nr:hypothetical protein JR316_0009153 [Psilocybe cubensis]KAH9478695.1 hypothetical protein JR316_0009153 [Psilocybe cubensis]